MNTTAAKQAIPTTYNSRRFRSRLEARWAAFFDLVGWHWEYEPVDLKGWIPDFWLKSPSGGFFAEVKPIFRQEEFSRDKIRNAVPPNSEILLLGATIFESECMFGDAAIGWWITHTPSEDDQVPAFDWDEANMNYYNHTFGIIGGWGSWYDRITDLYRGDEYIALPEFSAVLRLWNLAGNRAQWNPR